MKLQFVFTIAPALIFLFLSQPSPAQIQYEVHFACNMEVQILVGNFNPSAPTDHLYVRGAFNGWGTDDEMFDADNDFIYTATVFMNLVPAVDTMQYKYMYSSATVGDIWESGDNRTFWATGSEPDLNGNGIPDIVIPVRFFDEETIPDPWFWVDTPVIFEVDMRPAFRFLAHSGPITFPPGSGNQVTSIDAVHLASGAIRTTPTLAWIWALPPGDPLIDSLEMKDDGSNGDLAAGDSIYSITIIFHILAPGRVEWKHGINLLDNESAYFETYDEILVNLPSGRVRKQFGECGLGPVHTNWYSNYITALTPDGRETEPPAAFRLYQNYPNPFNPTTTIEYHLSIAAPVKLAVYDISGREIITLVNERQLPGEYAVKWNGLNASGQPASSGVYFARLEAGQFSAARKMILLR